MNKFLTKTVILLCVLFVLNVILDYGITRFLNHSELHMYKPWNHIINDTLEADLLVMGSSRAQRQYDTRIMDSMLLLNTYNLGLRASHVNRQIVIYKVYRHYQRKKPSFLLVNFDYWGNWVGSNYEREQFFPYLANPFVRRLVLKYEHFVMRELYLPMYRYYSQGLLSLMDKDDTARFSPKNWYNGYWGYSLGWDGEEIKNVEKIEFKTNASIVEDFDAFLSELQKDGVKVIFVSSPICAMATKKLVNPSEFYEFRDRFSEKYNIPVLDYIDDAICNDTTYFSNATHLNRAGAELFTTKLCQDLDSLGLLRR